MSVKTVLFDLDGTLLPMPDQDLFVNTYTQYLARYMIPHGYDDPKLFIKALWTGTGAMLKNDGSCLNEDAFWAVFSPLVGRDARADEPIFRTFYETEFRNAQATCGFAPQSAQIVRRLQQRGLGVILATNPLFPAAATEERIRWAGLTPEDFQLYTTYENATCCKPNPAYYQEILDKLGLRAEECAMVGNDVDEDMIPAESMGMQTFLLTGCLLNRSGADIGRWPHGDYEALAQWLETL